jgi:hypothetical protein
MDPEASGPSNSSIEKKGPLAGFVDVVNDTGVGMVQSSPSISRHALLCRCQQFREIWMRHPWRSWFAGPEYTAGVDIRCHHFRVRRDAEQLLPGSFRSCTASGAALRGRRSNPQCFGGSNNHTSPVTSA